MRVPLQVVLEMIKAPFLVLVFVPVLVLLLRALAHAGSDEVSQLVSHGDNVRAPSLARCDNE